MFILDGKPIALDVPFEANGTLYPANWLRLATADERAAIGITEEPDPPYYDQRFYWGYTASGTLIPKDHGVLVSGWVDETRQTANTLLSPYDWMIVREVDNGTPVPSGVKTWRQQIRLSCEFKVVDIVSTQTTDDLAGYITGSGYPIWPSLESIPETSPSGVAVINGNIIFSDTTEASPEPGI